MSPIKATFRNGRIEPDEPLALPEGTALLISLPQNESRRGAIDAWDDSPEGIAAWLKWFDALEPIVFTEKERAQMEADRQERRAWESSHFDERGEGLRRIWE